MGAHGLLDALVVVLIRYGIGLSTRVVKLISDTVLGIDSCCLIGNSVS